MFKSAILNFRCYGFCDIWTKFELPIVFFLVLIDFGLIPVYYDGRQRIKNDEEIFHQPKWIKSLSCITCVVWANGSQNIYISWNNRKFYCHTKKHLKEEKIFLIGLFTQTLNLVLKHLVLVTVRMCFSCFLLLRSFTFFLEILKLKSVVELIRLN